MGRISERAVEYAFVMQCLAELYPGKILDVGTGPTALPALMAQCGFSVQALDKAWENNRYFPVKLLDITRLKLAETFDFISCVSVLEHIPEYDAAMANMVEMLNPGGHICLTFPYNEDRYIGNVYQLEGSGYGQSAPFICQVFCWEQVSSWAERYNLKLVKHDRWRCFTGEFWTFGKRVFPPVYAGFDELHHLSCILFRKAT